MRRFLQIGILALVASLGRQAWGEPATGLTDAASGKGQTRVSIAGGRWLLDGEPTYPRSAAEGLLMNVRMVNAVFEDRKKPDFDADKNTAEFLDKIPEYKAHGVLAFTVCLQGGNPGYEGAENSAFNANGSLRGPYMERVRRVIEACDRQGMAVILGCYYQRQSALLEDEAAIRAGVANVVQWLRREGFRNVLLEIANEYRHRGFAHPLLRSAAGEAALIRLAKEAWPELLVSASGYGDGKLHDEVAQAADFLLIHFNGTSVNRIPDRIAELRKYGKPIVCNEDAKVGREAAHAAEVCVAHRVSWGLMEEKVNQHAPFVFGGAEDDPVVYATLKRLTEPVPSGKSATVFPGREWEEATPESQGIDSGKLRAAVEYLDTHTGRDGAKELVVIRHGRIIWRGPNIDKKHGIWSTTKSFTGTVLGLLIEDGKCSLNTRANQFVPELGQYYADVTLRHFTTMTSGYKAMGDRPEISHGQSPTPFKPDRPLFSPPGSHYAYWDSAMNQFAHVLTRIAGEPIEDLFRRRIADPIGMNRANWNWGDFGAVDGLVINCGAGNHRQLEISARELARLGLLFLNRGNWNGRQLIRSEWVQEATSVQVPASIPLAHKIDGRGTYGFNWWVNGIKVDGRRKWPGAPAGTFAASGHNNNDMFVIPEWDMVIVRLGLDGKDLDVPDETYSDFLEAVGKAISR